MTLAGKVALVTGAARGIGRGIALGLAKAGTHVVLSDLGDESRNWSYGLSSKEQLDETTREVEAHGVQALAVPCDVTLSTQVDVLIATALETFGQLDIVVNNAGIVHFAPMTEIDENQWDRIFSVNVKGVFLVSRSAIPSLVKTEGVIINIASVAGKRGRSRGTAYCGSKFAVVGVTQSLAAELAPQGVRVNAICPGIVDTAMHRDHLAPAEGAFEAIVNKLPFGREQTPEDIAEAVCYLAQAKNVTGISLNVAGGVEYW